ncbi:hypothetical protein [Lactococcus phage P087]|uniref:Uncharacterized protein n=1 Tax=Lactococcus phage P087 TaxID=641487 RepID=C3U2P0_9CAUD|nr:hypothetical protein P087_gp50 [Lactococcus phage P087]ACP41726.1 hypothetical protein [Lactococcus phage P087]
MSKLRDWFDKTPTVSTPTKEELNKANSRLTQLAGGGSSVERPPRTNKAQIPSDWNKEIKEDNPALDLINGYRAELNNPYVSSIIVKDVLWMLDEIENAL